MGFSPGQFDDMLRNEPVHWEGKYDCIILWREGEMERIIRLDVANARKALDQLTLLVEMLEAGRL